MIALRSWLVLAFAVVVVTAPTGCFRNGLWKKKEGPLPGSDSTLKLPEPNVKAQMPRDLPTPIASPVQPPIPDSQAGAAPLMPGMPGSPSAPISTPKPPPGVPSSVPDSPLPPTALNPTGEAQLVSADAPDGPIRRVIENIRERREERKEVPPLPPATEVIKPPEPPAEVAALPPRLQINKPAPPMNPGHVAAARKILEAAITKYTPIPDYECKMVRREVVNGKAQPAEELIYQYRKEPMSVYMKVTGEVGKGREVLYVKGQNNGKMTIVTGVGDNRLIGAGTKMDLDPDSSLVAGKSRHRIYEAGMERQLVALNKFVEAAEKGTRQPSTIKHYPNFERKEYSKPMDAIEVTLLPGDDPLLPKGGKRTYYFDNDAKSQAAGLPVMVITMEPGDKEVEYYSFRDFRMPAKLTKDDFSPDRLGKKK